MELITSICVTGHGSGGGLATIAAPYLSEIYADKEVVCCTFGAPRVGNHNFIRFFNSRVRWSYRFTNCFDPVPSLPFWEPFTHAHDSLCMKEDGLVRRSAEVVANARPEINPVEDYVNAIRYSDAHRPEEYTRRIEMLCSPDRPRAAHGA